MTQNIIANFPGSAAGSPVTDSERPSPVAWVFTDAADRTSKAGFVAADLDKFGKDLDTKALFRLDALGPPTVWEEVTATAIAASVDTIQMPVLKASPGTITKGQAIRISSCDPINHLVELAKADDPATAATGVAGSVITDTVPGIMVVVGEIEGFNTSLQTAGDPVHLSAVVAGALVFTPPFRPDIIQNMGVVLHVDAVDGHILVNAVRTQTPALDEATPQPVGAAGAAGSSTKASPSDHVHARGNGGAFKAQPIWDDFVTGNLDTDEIGAMGWRDSGAGAGNDMSVLSDAGHPGIVSLEAGTLGTGRKALFLGSNIAFAGLVVDGSASIELEWMVRLSGSIGAADLEMVQFGLGLEWTVAGELLNGVYMRFNPTGDTTFVVVAATAGVRTAEAGTTVVVIDTWYRVGLVISDPGGTPSVQLVVNGSDEGDPVTTNIPAAALGFGVKVDSAGGGTSPAIDVDYAALRQDLGDRED